jgi:diaminopimelate decarboxylase
MGRSNTSGMSFDSSWEEVSKRLKKIWLTDIEFSDAKTYSKYVTDLIKKRDVMLESAKKYGTPQYLLDEEALIARAGLLREAFQKYAGNVRLFYAFKCNDLPRIIKVLKNAGVNADVAGIFELRLALKFGFERIIFTSPGKSDDELLLAMDNSDRVIINVDNLDEFRRIISLYEKNYLKIPNVNPRFKIEKKLRISFRMNISSESMDLWSKFGISPRDLRDVSKELKRYPYISWDGLHFHSSWNMNPDKHVACIKKIAAFLKNNFSREELKKLKFMDVGGGFMCEGSVDFCSETDKGEILRMVSPDNPLIEMSEQMKSLCNVQPSSVETFAKTIGDAFNTEVRKNLGLKDIELWIEPGRLMVSLSTHILLRVKSIKGNSVIVDGGINLIGGHDAESTFFPIVNISKPSNDTIKSIVYGPLCDPHDLWGYQYFGGDAKIGDVLVVMHQGAYTYATAWKFIKPIAKYVSFHNGKLSVVKDEETFTDRYGRCLF